MLARVGALERVIIRRIALFLRVRARGRRRELSSGLFKDRGSLCASTCGAHSRIVLRQAEARIWSTE